MRLGTCVALELFTGASLALGLAISVSWGMNEYRSRAEREAIATEAPRDVAPEMNAVASAASAAPSIDKPAPGEPAPVASFELDLSQVGQKAPTPGGDSGGDSQAPSASRVADLPIQTAEELGVDPAIAAIVQPTPEPMVPGIKSPGDDDSWKNAPYYGVFNGARDIELLAPLRSAGIRKIKFNRGGSSISLRIDFTNGARAAFKPRQIAPQTVPRKEIAAYRVDRILGIGAVPPAIARKFKAEVLLDSIVTASQSFIPRLEEEMRVRNGYVAGELSWWIPIIRKAKVNGFEIDTTDGIVTWKRYLTAGRDMPEKEIHMLAQISNMVLFDFIINNPDRWSGANARTSDDHRFLYFMDNTMAFGPDPDGHRKARTYFQRSQKFSKTIVGALRKLTEDDVRAALSWDLGPYDYLLADIEIKALMKRRDWALGYVDGLIEKHGESKVLVFP